MVENVKLVRNGHTSGFQVGKGSDNVPIFHVAFGVVIAADDKDTGVPTSSDLHQKMQMKVIFVIFRDTYLSRSGSVGQMLSIAVSCGAGIDGKNDDMAGVAEVGRQ